MTVFECDYQYFSLILGVYAADRHVVNVIPPTAEAGFDIRISPNMETEHVSG
jgi:acetylornithine deacetylase/succinyl-diaminopimelate desuccinylase-like protein